MNLWDILTKSPVESLPPGKQLYIGDTATTLSGPTSGFWGWVNHGLSALLQASPEILTIAAMCCLLVGMVGSRKFMSWAYTCVLLAFISLILCAVL